jgi:ATP/maltotriose-dependent transcriptional regulator MalT
MDQGTAASQSVSSPELIDRPRLRGLLERSAAPVILLVAPAGYGKTTLARQWLSCSKTQIAWFSCTEASTDVAALALGIARSASELFPNASHLLESRLRGGMPYSEDPATLAEILAAATNERLDAWFVLDDYHHLMQSGPAEQLIAQLVDSRTVRMLVASRRRPSWAAARKLLYGEIEEIPRSLLAMTEAEAAEVLKANDSQAEGLIARAEGWPAVIGLAARSGRRFVPDGITHHLYDFFAQELYESATEGLRRDLHRLSILPSTTAEHLHLIFGERTDEVVTELLRLGFLTASQDASGVGNSVDLHPLIRDFLADKLLARARKVVETEASEIARLLCDSCAWDDAFLVINRFGLAERLSELLERSLAFLLDEGRTTTIEAWLTAARQMKLRSPVLDVAHAELALRRGAWHEAVTLGSTAADALDNDHWLKSRALNCAARAAHFSDRGETAVTLHTHARAVARRPEDLREALWGKFVVESELGRADEARSTLDEYAELDVCDGDDLLRRATGRLVLAVRHGPLHEAVRIAPKALLLLSGAEDPITRTGFLQMYTYAMTLAGRYVEARDSAITEVEEAERYHLDFVEIHALCGLAIANLGLREYASAEATLNRVESRLRSSDDQYAEMSVSTSRMRLALIRRDESLALGEAEKVWARAPTKGIYGDLLATRALVYLWIGKYDLAERIANSSERATSQPEARLLAKWVRAVSLIRQDAPQAQQKAIEAYDATRSMGMVDPFVITYRAFPELLWTLGDTPVKGSVAELLVLVGDQEIARQAGIVKKTRPQGLSRREQEVLELLGRGLSNRAIAKALWISESTTKVHVRHIFDKLNVRTRTEAALLARGSRPDDSIA